MGKPIKCLLDKQEDLCPNHQHPYNKAGHGCCMAIAPGKVETREYQEPVGQIVSTVLNSKFSERLCLKK